MNRKLKWMVVVAGVAAGLPWMAGAQQPAEAPSTYTIDPVHTCVWFRIRHLNIGNFYGRFNRIEGTFVWDEANPENNRLEATVPVESIDTNNVDRDKHLKSEEYFHAERFPTMTFKSRAFKKSAENEYLVQGELTLRGVTKPISLKLERIGAGQDPWGNQRLGLETTFTIQRSEFGLNAMPGALGEDVRLTIALEGIRQK